MIDLHIHTNNSDGTDSVETILQKAEDLKLEYISITDHETCSGYKVLKDMPVEKYYKGKIIPGIELKSYYHGKVIDILGYLIDTDEMNRWISEFYKGKSPKETQMKYFRHYYKVLENLGVKLLPEEEIDWVPGQDWASVIIYRELKRFEENSSKVPQDLWDSFDVFKKDYCYNPKTDLYVDKSCDYPSVKQTIQIIKDVGGYSFLAHAYVYQWFKDNNQFIDDIINHYEINGIETYYSKFTQEQINYLLELTQEKKLYRSGGTDYHGENNKGIELGVGRGNLKVPTEIINDWYKNK